MTEAAADRAGASAEYSVEESEFGRIVVAPQVPDGFAVLYTTRDFEGHLNRGSRMRSRVSSSGDSESRAR